MNTPPSLTNNLLKDIENYAKTGAEYLEVNCMHRAVSILSVICFSCITFLSVLLCISSLLLGIAWWVGSKVNNNTLGFMFAAVLLITGLSFFTIFQSAFIKTFRNKLISSVYS